MERHYDQIDEAEEATTKGEEEIVELRGAPRTSLSLEAPFISFKVTENHGDMFNKSKFAGNRSSRARRLNQCAEAVGRVAVTRWIRVRCDLCFGGQFENCACRTGKVSLNVKAFPTAGWIGDGDRIDGRSGCLCLKNVE